MTKIILIISATMTISACTTLKSSTTNSTLTAPTTPVPAPKAVEPGKTLTHLWKEHYNLPKDFTTLQINASVQSNQLDVSVGADIRIQKGEKILINIKKFGFTLAKVLITPDRVSYYENINGKSYDGDYSIVNNFLKTQLNYQMIENLLIGKTLETNQNTQAPILQHDQRYTASVEKQNYTINYTFNTAMQLITQALSNQNQQCQINYQDYTLNGNVELPRTIQINAQDGKTKSMYLNIEYDDVSVDKELKFSYKIPQ